MRILKPDQRWLRIPWHHIEAEMAAFPLASVASFENGITQLDPSLKDEATRRLWRAAERQALSHVPSLSVDEATALRDQTWFGNQRSDNGRRSMLDFLCGLSERHLQPSGSYATPLPDEDDKSKGNVASAQARWRWRWMTFALPEDLLLAGLCASSHVHAYRVYQGSPKLYRALHDKGFNESHLHLNAGLTFRQGWASLMATIGDAQLTKESMFRSPGAEFEDGKDMGAWLIRAAIVRFALARFLAERGPQLPFPTFFDRLIDKLSRESLGAAVSNFSFRGIFLEMASGRLSASNYPSFDVWQTIYNSWTGQNIEMRFLQREVERLLNGAENPSVDRLLGLVERSDPISRFYPEIGHDGPSAEMRFCLDGFAYIEGDAACGNDTLFPRLFWQLIRMRVIFYRHVIQRPMTPGLLWFTRFYERMRPARVPWLAVRIVSAAQLNGLDHGLRSLEVRIAPESDLSAFRKYVQDILQGFSVIRTSGREIEELETGIVVHFPRIRGGGFSGGVPAAFWQNTSGDPGMANSGANNLGFRHGAYYRQQRRSAEMFSRLIIDNPELVSQVRGIDICTDELGVPTWIFVPIFRYLRDAFAIAASRKPDSAPFPNLRTTVHCGEEFVHLTTGLRRIDEARRFLGLSEGDRLGHGMALGVDPQTWAEAAGRITIGRIDRLFDLVWEYSWFTHGHPVVSTANSIYLQHQIFELSTVIFGESVTADQALNFYLSLHSEEALRASGFADGNRAVNYDDVTDRLVAKYLRKREIFDRGRELVQIDPIDDVGSLCNLQRLLKQRLGQLGVTVEVNPSSNLLIGHLGDLASHPLWRIMPVDESSTEPSVDVCIGSDDPLTFNTNLRMEYQLVEDAMLRSGFSEGQTRSWLERVRNNGLDARFTARSPLPKVLYRGNPTTTSLPAPMP